MGLSIGDGITAADSVIGAPVVGGTANRVLFIDSSGNLAQSANFVFNGSQLRVPDGTAADPGVAFANSTGTGVYHTGGVMGFATSGVSRAIVGSGQWQFANTLATGWTDAYISRYAAKQVMISGDGTGATTNAGFVMGYGGTSGESAIWSSTVTPGIGNYALKTAATATLLNAVSGGTVSILTAGDAATRYMRWTGTAGEGTQIVAGTATTDVNAIAITQTMNAAAVNFTGIKATFTEGASGTGGSTLLLNLLYGTSGAETRVFSVAKNGTVTINNASSYLDFGTGATTSVRIQGDGGVLLGATSAVRWGSAAPYDTPDVILTRDAAGVLAQRNSTNAQVHAIYNTYTSSTSLEALAVGWSGDVCFITTQAGSGGGSARALIVNGGNGLTFRTGGSTSPAVNGGSTRWEISTSGHLLAGTDNTYDIGANGATRPRSLFVGTNVTAGTGGVFQWSGRGSIAAAADGVFLLRDDAASSFGRLQFGGTTSSFPSLKRSTTSLLVVLADDSAYTNFIAKNYVSSGGYVEGDEIAEPSAPGANQFRLFAQDNGAGKTQLCVRFNSGVSQVIATEP